MEGLRRRESPAFEEFCRRHLPRVRRIVYRVLRSDSDISDVTQEVIIRAMGSAPKFRGTSAQLEGWVTRIAIYTAKDTIRKRYSFRSVFSSEELDCEYYPARVTSVEQRETVRRTYAALDRLSIDERIAFTLRVVDGMKLEHVAEACGVSLSTAKRRVRRARKNFDRIAQRDPILRDLLQGDHR